MKPAEILMATSPRLAAPLFAAALLLTGCAPVPAYQPVAPGTTVVEMTNDPAFDPPSVTIRAGQTVEWRNLSQLDHTVTANNDDPGTALPRGAQPLNSGEVLPGDVYRATLTVPGTYRYICEMHRNQGMSGIVVVTP